MVVDLFVNDIKETVTHYIRQVFFTITWPAGQSYSRRCSHEVSPVFIVSGVVGAIRIEEGSFFGSWASSVEFGAVVSLLPGSVVDPV